MKIKPRNEYVVVSLRTIKNNAGIIIPGQETERSIMIVEAVGPGGFVSDGTRAPIEVADGEPLVPGTAVFVRHGEYEQFKEGDKQYLIVPQGAIIGVEIEEPAPPVVIN